MAHKPADSNAVEAPAAGVITEPAVMKWYIVHTYSGHENRARLSLMDRAKTANLTECFGQILVPTESVSKVVEGQKRTTTRKFFPGYIFVQMMLDDRTFNLVKNTAKVTGFLGGTKPSPVPEREITGLQTTMVEGKAPKKIKVSFEVGETVRVVEGPFANFSGTVEQVNIEKAKLRVSVSMFSRATSVELDFNHVEKA